MEIVVTNDGSNYHAETSGGTELDIAFGPGTPDEDATMNPVELFVSSLGMCIAAMLRKYCTEHDLDCGEIRVRLQDEWEPGDPMCKNIQVEVEVEGDFDQRRKSAFLKVAETCPVHQTISSCDGVNITIV